MKSGTWVFFDRSCVRPRPEEMHYQQLLVIFTVTTPVFAVFPDNTVVLATLDHFLYSDQVENWTSAKIDSGEFSQSVSPLSLDNVETIAGIAADRLTKHLVVSDKQSQSLLVVDLEASNANYFHIGTSEDVGQLTIDWLGRNVYWADTGYAWIAMKKLPDNILQHDSRDPNFRVVVDEYLEKPTGLVIHPQKFYLFWTDTGETLKIERSDLIGGNREVIIWHSLITPTTLCIDQPADRLYWSDPGRGTVEYSDFDGNGRTVLLSDPHMDYYGIAVFRDSLIYTAPIDNVMGYVSLKENIEGEHVQARLQYDEPLYHVLVYSTELQNKPPQNTLCDTLNECEQMCLYMEQDAGFTCLCDDGYDLISGQHCTADEQILERNIIFTNKNTICTIAITVLALPDTSLLDLHCDIVTEDTVITRFATDMKEKVFYYTNGSSIYKEEAFKANKSLLYKTNGTAVTDMDYDWKTKQLYWFESGDGYLYFTNVSAEHSQEPGKKKLSDSVTTHLAVDPHNRKVFWTVIDLGGYSLNAWDTVNDEIQLIQTSLLKKPTDLEYDRLKDRLLWYDEEGYVGMIKTDGTQEKKYVSAEASGAKTHAITVYKNFIFTTSAENRQFEITYELSPSYEQHLSLHEAYDGPVLDLHIYESALQPSDLEPCEVDNGGCDHICLPGYTQKCACSLGYILDTDKRTCKTAVVDGNFFVILDTVHYKLYQVDLDKRTPYAIEINLSNKPTAVALHPTRKEIIWVDADKGAVKKKVIGTTNEIAVWSGVDVYAALTLDVSTGNIYLYTGGEIILVSPYGDKLTIIDSAKIEGFVKKIAVMPKSGLMSWFDDQRVMVANMDGSNIQPINVDMRVPEDITFDLSDEKNLYWCDSDLDKIEKINTLSLSTEVIYSEHGLRPVAIDIVGDALYFVPRNQRRIVQINKINGQGQMDVFESPLFGSITNFFFSQNIEGHSVCKECNGGCSNLCLPMGKSRRCACADGISLKDGESVCQYADVCPQDSFTSKPGLESLTDCCPSLPNAVCKPSCLSGYETRASVVECKIGKWNVSLDSVCSEAAGGSLPVAYIGAGVGGAVVVVVIIIISLCVWRRKKSTPNVKDNNDIQSGKANHGYDDAIGVLSPDPPVRQPEPEVYAELDETEMIDASKLHVEMPIFNESQKKEAPLRNSSSSDRYTTFPAYLATTYERKWEPTPDYMSLGQNGGDGYLQASSVSGSSRDASYGSHSRTSYSGKGGETDSRRQNDADGYLTAISVSVGSISWHRDSHGQMAMSNSRAYSGHN